MMDNKNSFRYLLFSKISPHNFIKAQYCNIIKLSIYTVCSLQLEIKLLKVDLRFGSDFQHFFWSIPGGIHTIALMDLLINKGRMFLSLKKLYILVSGFGINNSVTGIISFQSDYTLALAISH